MGQLWGCDNLEDYVKLNCETDVFHYNRITGLAILKKPSIIRDLTDPLEWAKYVDGDPTATPTPTPNTYNIATDMTVMYEVRGTYEPADPEMMQGYGDRYEIQKNRLHTVEAFFVYHKKNEPFYQNAEYSDNAGIAFLSGDRATGDLQVMQGVNATVVIKTNITELLSDFREGSIKITWSRLRRMDYVDNITQKIRDIFF